MFGVFLHVCYFGVNSGCLAQKRETLRGFLDCHSAVLSYQIFIYLIWKPNYDLSDLSFILYPYAFTFSSSTRHFSTCSNGHGEASIDWPRDQGALCSSLSFLSA